MSFNKIYKHYY